VHHQILGLCIVLGLIEDTPLLDHWLIKHLVLRQWKCQLFSLILDAELDALGRFFASLKRNSVLVICWQTHHDVAGIVLEAFDGYDGLIKVKPPLFHVFLACSVLHQVVNEFRSLLNLDRGISTTSYFDLDVWLPLLNELLVDSHESAQFWRQVDHLVTSHIVVHQHRLAKVCELNLVPQL